MKVPMGKIIQKELSTKEGRKRLAKRVYQNIGRQSAFRKPNTHVSQNEDYDESNNEQKD